MKKITLRSPRATDRHEFLNLVTASRALHRPWVYPPADARSFDEYLEKTRGENFVSLLACRCSDGAITGVFNLSQISYENFGNAYLGYWVGAPFAKQGYMASARKASLRAI